VSRRGSIFQVGKQYLDTKIKSTKQSEDPESTKALIDTGNRREESMTSKEFKPLSVTVPRYSIVSLTDSRQLAPQGGR